MTSCEIVLIFIALMSVHRVCETYVTTQTIHVSDIFAFLMCVAGILIL